MNALIVGKRRQGKSTLALRLAMCYHHTIIVFDPNVQYHIKDAPLFTSIESFEEWLENDDVDHGLVVYRPDTKSIQEEFRDCVDLMWPKGHYAFIIDESTYVQGHNRIHPSLEKLVRQAPRDGARNAAGAIVDVSVIQTLHRPADSNSLCRALASDTWYFQVSLPRDLEAVQEQWGDDVAEKLTDLGRWCTVHAWQGNDGKEQYTIWQQPSEWYININSGSRSAS